MAIALSDVRFWSQSGHGRFRGARIVLGERCDETHVPPLHCRAVTGGAAFAHQPARAARSPSAR